MNLQERLQQLAVERQNLIVALHEVNGAMKILEQQILEIQEHPKQASHQIQRHQPHKKK